MTNFRYSFLTNTILPRITNALENKYNIKPTDSAVFSEANSNLVRLTLTYDELYLDDGAIPIVRTAVPVDMGCTIVNVILDPSIRWTKKTTLVTVVGRVVEDAHLYVCNTCRKRYHKSYLIPYVTDQDEIDHLVHGDKLHVSWICRSCDDTLKSKTIYPEIHDDITVDGALSEKEEYPDNVPEKIIQMYLWIIVVGLVVSALMKEWLVSALFLGSCLTYILLHIKKQG